MPSALALCARSGGPARSPIAYTPGTEVSIFGETLTNPRSMATPSASSPRAWVFAPRPTAISTRAASTRAAWPSCSSSTVTPSRPTRTAWTFTPVRTSIFRLAKLRARSFEISSSSIGKSRGSASTIVTWTP